MTSIQTQTLRVVVADDSAESRELLRAMLNTLSGVQVVGMVANGRHAVEALRTLRPDAVFLDIAMPVMDGLEAATMISARYPDVKVIVHSGYDRMAMEMSALSAGADEYFEKAGTVRQLLDQLRQVFPDRELTATSPAGGDLLRPDVRGAAVAGRRLHDWFDAMLEGMAILSAVRDQHEKIVDFRYEFVNDVACRLNQLSREQMIGHLLCDVLPEHRASGLFDAYVQVVTTRVPLQRASMIYQDLCGSGRRMSRAFDLQAVPSGDGFVVSWREVTDTVVGQQALRNSEYPMRAAFDAMPDGVVVLSPVHGEHGGIVDFRFDDVNEQACLLSNLTREQHLGHLMSDVLPTLRTSELFDDFVKVITTGEPLRKPWLSTAASHGDSEVTTRVWDVTAAPLGDGIIDIFRDVTGQHALHAELEASEELLRGAVRTLEEGFFLTRAIRGTGGRITDLEYIIANDAGCRMTHRTEAQYVGHRYRELFPNVPSGRFERYCAVVDTALPCTEVVEGDPALGLGGLTFTVSVTQVGDGCVFVLNNITERRRGEQELSEAKTAAESRAGQLEAFNQELQVFASAISHDLREPLRTTAGFVGLIQDRHSAELPEPVRELFSYVLSGTQRMDQRITALLDYARSGAAVAPPRPIDSSAVAHAAATDVAGVLDAAGAQVHIGDLPTIFADPVQLQRVFQNLLSNAAMYRDSTVTPRIRISAERLDGHWQFTVADNGPGIPVNDRDRIFTMFRRGCADDGRDGHGMGLSLCRRIIDSYDGRIWVQDNPGGGSQFCFTLPAATTP